MKKGKGNTIIQAFIVFSFLMLLIFQSQRQSEQEMFLFLTTNQKLSEFHYLCNLMDESYPFWIDLEKEGIDKETIYHQYEQKIMHTKNDIQYMNQLNNFVKSFGHCGHLSLFDGRLYESYMQNFVNSIDGVEVSDEDLKNDPELFRYEMNKQVMTGPVTRHTYSCLKSGKRGFYYNRIDHNSKVISKSSSELKLDCKVFDHDKTAYIRIPDFLIQDPKDAKVLTDYYRSIQDMNNLIIDIRGNGGGSDAYWKKMIVEPNLQKELSYTRYYLFNLTNSNKKYALSKLPNYKIYDINRQQVFHQYVRSFSKCVENTVKVKPTDYIFKGKIWLLVDQDVYSASENFAQFCKETGFATLVGTTTGGDGCIYEPMLFDLPQSGLVVRFSILYGLNLDGSGNEAYGTLPDVMTKSNEDALNKCLSLIDAHKFQ